MGIKSLLEEVLFIKADKCDGVLEDVFAELVLGGVGCDDEFFGEHGDEDFGCVAEVFSGVFVFVEGLAGVFGALFDDDAVLDEPWEVVKDQGFGEIGSFGQLVQSDGRFRLYDRENDLQRCIRALRHPFSLRLLSF